MFGEFISPQDSKWSQLLGRTRHDFYHLPEYVALAAGHEEGQPAAFYAYEGDAAFLVPLLIQDVPAYLGAPPGWKDAKSPYGYPTPLLVAADDPITLQRFFEVFRRAAAEQCIVTAFLRLHPLLPLPIHGSATCDELVRHGETVCIDLTLPEETIWKDMRENHRRDIRKLNKIGFRVEIDRWEYFQAFIDIYVQSMERCCADEFYFFDDEYFTGLRQALAERLHLCTVLSATGDVAAAGLFTAVHGIVQYHLGGTTNECLRLSPTKLMFDALFRWAKDAGNTVFHLGGGVGCSDDSLFRFKAGFSEWTTDFYTYRMVLDQEKYIELNRMWQERCNDQGGDPGFFPRYRVGLGHRS
jgi:CelD/BcsL family acetyltransferase involved in cellulose biosynthesis